MARVGIVSSGVASIPALAGGHPQGVGRVAAHKPTEIRLFREPPTVIGVACAGGLLRCFSVLGALLRLEEAGLRPGVITGSSSGALISVVAARWGAREAVRISRDMCATGNRLWRSVFGFGDWRRLGFGRAQGLISLQRMGRWVEGMTGLRRLEHLPIRVGVCVTDVMDWKPRVFHRGPIGPMVAASCSLRGAQPIRLEDGREYLDGGLTANLPVRACYDLGARVVLALDGVGSAEACEGSDDGVMPDGSVSGRGRLQPDARPDLWLRMGTTHHTFVDLRRWEALLEFGYEAAARIVRPLQRALRVHCAQTSGVPKGNVPAGRTSAFIGAGPIRPVP